MCGIAGWIDSAGIDPAVQERALATLNRRALAVLDLSRLARRSVKFVLTGDGGDEIFGGYGWHETVMRYEALRGRLAFLDPVFSAAHRAVAGPLSGIPFASRAAGSSRILAGNLPDR